MRNLICDLDPTPVNERGEYDDRPVDMMSNQELRGYISQLRSRYSRVKDVRPADAEALRSVHDDLMAEFRLR